MEAYRISPCIFKPHWPGDPPKLVAAARKAMDELISRLLVCCVFDLLCHDTYMRSHHITLSEPLSRVVDTQVKSGRFKDFSAAVQEALWKHFVGPESPFDEYQVSPKEVEQSAQRELSGIKKDRKAGRLKAWKP
jgi:hypothetical protein